MVSNRIALLLQQRLRDAAVPDHGHVVCLDIAWSIDGDTHHPELVSQAFHHLHCCLHSGELRPKASGLNGGLFLGEPDNWGILNEQEDPSP